MAVAIYIISVVVIFLGIILWATNDILGDEVDSLKELVNDYNVITIKKITTLEKEIKTLKEEVKTLKEEVKALENEVELSSPYSNF